MTTGNETTVDDTTTGNGSTTTTTTEEQIDYTLKLEEMETILHDILIVLEANQIHHESSYISLSNIENEYLKEEVIVEEPVTEEDPLADLLLSSTHGNEVSIVFANIFIGLILGYIGMKGMLQPWR